MDVGGTRNVPVTGKTDVEVSGKFGAERLGGGTLGKLRG